MAPWSIQGRAHTVTLYLKGVLLSARNHKKVQASPHFFLPPAPPVSSLLSHAMTFPSMTTPFPSMKATRERPSQFLKVSHTRGCCGTKLAASISLDFKECGSSIFLPHLPRQLRDAASRAAATHEADGRVADLNLV